MNRNLATIARVPARTHRSSELLGVSAAAYLTLALGLGVHIAFYLVAAAAIVAIWAAACRRFRAVGFLTGAFFCGFVPGLISGLIGGRRRR